MENVASVHPLTPVQAGMLFHALEGTQDGAYVVQYTSVVTGPLDTTRLRGAWEAVVREHAALRTAILFEGLDEPLQVVRETATLPWSERDWSDVPATGHAARLQDFLDDDRRRGFDLARAPLMRITCIRLSPERHQLVWTYHHIVVDGWSSVLLLDQVWQHYRGAGVPNHAPRQTFGDFVDWARTADTAASEHFWIERLRGAALPTVPGFAPPMSRAPRAHQRERIQLTTEETQRLRTFAAQHRLTLGTVVHGAWALTLARCAASPDVVYGATVAGRPAGMPDVDQIVGAFINTLPVRVRTDGEQPLHAWLTALQHDLLDVREHELTSLQDIARWMQVPAARLFETILVFENAPATTAAPGGDTLRIDDEEYYDQSNFGFALLAHPRDALDLYGVYRPERITGDAARRLLQGMADTLRAMPDAAQVAVRDLGPPTGAELATLRGPLATSAPAPTAVTDVVGSFVHHAEHSPESIAIIGDDGRWSYAQLHQQARELAARVQALGIGEGDRVAILARKGPAFIAAVLATLGLRAAYVPLDPEYPAARLTLMARLSGARIILTDDAAQVAVLGITLPVVPLTGARTPAEAVDAASPGLPALATNAAHHDAYVIFTSGSTGTPKGVAVTRANLAFSTAARTAVYGSRPPRFLLLSPVGFDSSVAGLFWPLTLGGAVVVTSTATERSPRELGRLIAERAVTTTLCVPSFHQLLLEQADAQHLQRLQTVTVAGEACPPRLVRQHRECLPTVALVNEYGPTECTVWSTWVALDQPQHTTQVPIGRPIPGATVRVLDAIGRPVPIGVAGELCVGGPGVARGYVDQPDETARRFISDPLEPASRLYRTGDLVRMDDAGVLTFLGRNDGQLKIRGFRIEPHEIESALGQHHGIIDSVVVARSMNDLADDPESEALSLVQRLERLAPDLADQLLRSVE